LSDEANSGDGQGPSPDLFGPDGELVARRS